MGPEPKAGERALTQTGSGEGENGLNPNQWWGGGRNRPGPGYEAGDGTGCRTVSLPAHHY